MLLLPVLLLLFLLFSGTDAVLYRGSGFSSANSQPIARLPPSSSNEPVNLIPSSSSLKRHINDMNQLFNELSLNYQATPHRNSLSLLTSDRDLANSIRKEMLAYGERLPFIVLSQRRFPRYQQVVALPLRFPHGQGGPGTTLAVLEKSKGTEMKIAGFGHIGGVHPDDFVALLENLERGATSKVASLGKLYPALRHSSSSLKLIL